ncbi:MAG: hypothetical protein ACRCX2_07050 [Paraclostridium sp.]
MHIYHNLNYLGYFPYPLELIKKTYPQYCTSEHRFLETKLNYPKLENGSLVEKSDTELKLEGIIPLLEGEVIINNEIVVKPKPNGYKVEWNGQEWIETATLIEKEEILRNNIISKTPELLKFQSAGFNNLEIEKELETLKKLHLDITHQIAIK